MFTQYLVRSTWHLLTIVLSVIALGSFVNSHAQTVSASWPTKPIKFIVGYAAGSATDSTTRFFGEMIQRYTGQSVIVENRPGVDGNIAAELVARSPADGYTALVSGNSTHATNIHLYKKLSFDPEKDFSPVATFAQVPYVLIVNPTKIAAKSLTDFVAYAKANPGKLSYGSAAVASRVTIEQLKIEAGFEAVNVNYKASPQAMTDLLGGQIDFYVADVMTGMAQVRAGKVVPLGVTVSKRLAVAPDVPTIAEQGFAGYDFFSWLAVWVPAGSPPEAVSTMNALINRAMQSEEGKKFMTTRGLLDFIGTPEDLRRLQIRDTERWGKVIQATGMEQH
jgi:tripartite-type tricarboxylate transporter receptor subunit TctC